MTRLNRFRNSVRAVLLGPQLLAFLPAITLSGFWIGGEAALIWLALVMPVAFAIGGLFSREIADPGGDRDPVTGLPFRDDVVAAADRTLADGPTAQIAAAAFAIGLDEFRELTDRYGAAGSEILLRVCADRLEAVFRGNDVIGRLDGPRMAVLLQPGTKSDLESLIQAATRVQKAIQEPVSLDGTRVFLSASVGFCSARRVPEPTGEALISAAERALDDAMSTGTGAIRAFSIDMQRRARSRGSMADELSQALDEGQISPWYQPQIRADGGEITGLEALARWEHPEWGLVPPAEFLPAAEQLGLLSRLGEVMLYQTMNDLRAWDALGLDVPGIALNFSVEELRDPTIVERITFELDRFGIAPERLTVEVLETVIAQTANDTIIRNLRSFADIGCTIDLDDFGTGHASIANIKRFAVSRIKIDRSFVTQIGSDLEQQNIVTAILTLADRLELSTLAEGVETAAEQAILRKLGCGHLQVYGICRPMPFAEVEGWIAAHRATLADEAGEAAAEALAGTPATAARAAGEAGKTA